MSDIKLNNRYLPNLPPRSITDEVREYLREEFDLIALSINDSLDTLDALRSSPRMFLVGDPDDVLLDITPQKFVNFPQGGALGVVPIEPDLLTGDITIPTTGAYTVTAFAYGLQADPAQNESIRLLIDVNNVKGVVASIDIATSQTDDVTLLSVSTSLLLADDVVSMWIDATGDLGLFVMQRATLEIIFVTPVQNEITIL